MWFSTDLSSITKKSSVKTNFVLIPTKSLSEDNKLDLMKKHLER